jgi:hypothetical protein
VTFNGANGTLGTTFNVTVSLNMTETIFSWQIVMHYNRTELKATRAGYTAGATSEYCAGHTTIAPPPVIDTGAYKNGSVLASESLEDSDTIPGPHSGTLIWVEFQIMTVPTSGNFTSQLDISSEYAPGGAGNTFVLGPPPGYTGIDFTPYNGTYTFIGPSAPPSFSVSISANSTSISVGQSVLFTGTVTGGKVPYTYQWFLNSTGQGTAPGATYVVSYYTFIPSGVGLTSVYLNVTDATGTTMESNVVEVTVSQVITPTGAKIYVDPAQIVDPSLVPSSTFSINITLTSVASLGACTFNLTYNPQVLNWIGTEALRVQGEIPTALEIVNIGFVWMNLTYATAISADPPQPIVTIDFHVDAFGTSPLSLTDTGLFDPNGNPIPHNETDGEFSNGIREVAITNVTTASYWATNWAYQGGIINVTVTANDTGQLPESFYVSALWDTNVIGNVSVSLAAGAGINEVFMLNTTGLPLYQNLTISGQASIVPYEFNVTNNVFVDGNVTVRFVGDVNGDGKVDGRDITIIAGAFGTFGPNFLYPGSPPSPNWNIACDLNADNKIDGIDMELAAAHFGAHA